MDNNGSLVTRDNAAVSVQQSGELSPELVLAQVAKIQMLMKVAMKPNEHYGIIPGTNRKDAQGKEIAKPTLLKPGAEKLCLMFRLDPQYTTVEKMDGDHMTILSTCTLYHINSGLRMGSGMGSCSTKESKYAYRKSNRVCPSCGVDAIFKDKNGPGYYCWTKKDGCGVKFTDPGDIAKIESQETGRVPTRDIADQYNTVLKMANKRSLVAAVLNVTAASDIFTQDLEDLKSARSSLNREAKVEVVLDEKQKDTDKATPEQRKALLKATKDRLGDAEAAGWLKGQMASLGIASGMDLTIGAYKMVMEQLIEMDANDPADSFEHASDGN